MLIATNERHDLEISGTRQSVISGGSGSVSDRRLSSSGLIVSNNRVNHLVRFVYFLNAAIVLAGLGYITVTQKDGYYRCNRISVLFDEEIWEDAYVRLRDGSIKERLLIYSSFNGIFEGEVLLIWNYLL